MESITRSQLLEKLRQKLPIQWRVQSFSKTKAEATCVAYIDARDVMGVLDEFCLDGWANDYKEIKGNLFCGIGICINNHWEWRWDCGTESSTEKEKGEASDSFKRAAVKWGVGRFLYDLEIVRLPANAKKENNFPYVIDSEGKQVWNIRKHIEEGKHKIKSSQQTASASSSDSLKGARPQETKDAKPNLPQKAFNQAVERISTGEKLYDKLKLGMTLTPEQDKHLKDLETEIQKQINS